MIDDFRKTYEVLSNFSYTPVFYDDVYYPTSEHAFQASKTLNFDERLEISQLSSPREAKDAGRKVNLRSDWEDVKFDVMLDILRAKFTQNNYAAEILLSTGDEQLVEGNTWHDNCWGDCHCSQCLNIQGQNLLGQALMIVRNELRDN